MLASVTRVEILGKLKTTRRLFEPVAVEPQAYGEPQPDDYDPNDPAQMDDYREEDLEESGSQPVDR